MRSAKAIWIAIHVTNWLIILYFWHQSSGELLLGTGPELMIALARLTGLIAGYGALTQFFLMGRNPLLERVFGLDKLARFHQISGKTAFLFIVAHPFLIWFGYSKFLGTHLFEHALGFLQNIYTLLALISLGLFVLVVGTAITMVRKRLRYEYWYGVHLMIYGAIALVFWHQIQLGTTINASRFFYWYWVALYIVIFSSHLIFRFSRPFYKYFKHQFVISRVQKESPSATSIYISGKNMEKFKVSSGQFMFFRFLNKKLWWQAHPFSLSMLPSNKEIRITVKNVGDFTADVQNLTPGTKVFIDGPYGVFTGKTSSADKILMIAGGIGITPIRSLSEEFCTIGKDVVILYGNRSEPEIVFKNELDALQNKHAAKVVHILSEQERYAGEKGRIDEEKLRRLVPDIQNREVFLCGPPPMMEGIRSILEKMGIARGRIHFEKFSL